MRKTLLLGLLACECDCRPRHLHDFACFYVTEPSRCFCVSVCFLCAPVLLRYPVQLHGCAVFLLPVVEVFRVSIHACVIRSEKIAVFNGSSPQSRIFSSCVCG